MRQLEYFVAVADEASFTRAAGRVHVGQSAVSVAIRKLERELGAPLFERTTHEVALTDVGTALLPEAVRISISMPQPWEIALSIGLILVTIYAVLWMSSRIYRVGILMYGKKPTLGELLRWIRAG